jgi:AraC family transcriptional regulator
MSVRYGAFKTLQQHKAVLHDSIRLCSGIELAAWSNKSDCITQYNDHHTLSLYTADGYECYHKTQHGWRNGGAPNRFCILPKESESTWDIRANLSFVHLYCTDTHLRRLVERIWDRSPASIQVEERVFCDDVKITQLYRQFFLGCDWQEPSNHLLLSSTAMQLLTHMIGHYTQLHWALPNVKGGLSPTALKIVKEYIDDRLSQPLLLAELATQAGLSEFHFARMFKQSTGLAPHQYVMNARLRRAESLLKTNTMTLLDVAIECGFSSASHFSHRFKKAYGFTPSLLRTTNDE